MGICSFSSPQPIGVSFRFRKCKFRNISRNAIQHSALDIWSGLPTPARDFHRAGSPRLQASRWQIALLGILLEGLSGNRHRLPHQEPSHNRSPAVLRLIFGSSLAREPSPQVLQRHPRVAKGTSIDPLARGPSTEPLLGQGHVPKHLPTNLKPVSCRCFGWISARHPRREASRWHLPVARQSSIGSSSIKSRCFMDVEVRMGCSSMKCRYFMDVEVRIGFLSIKCRYSMDIVGRIGCSSIKCRYSMDIEVRIGCLSMKCRCFMDVEVRIGFLSIKCCCSMDIEVRIGCLSMK